jgi:hypothetical protein
MGRGYDEKSYCPNLTPDKLCARTRAAVLPALRQATEGRARSGWFVSTTTSGGNGTQSADDHELGGNDRQTHGLTKFSAEDTGRLHRHGIALYVTPAGGYGVEKAPEC